MSKTKKGTEVTPSTAAPTDTTSELRAIQLELASIHSVLERIESLGEALLNEPSKELPPAPAPAPATAPATVHTLDEVREALNAFVRVHGLGEASKVVSSLGVKRLTELPAERYGEALEALRR